MIDRAFGVGDSVHRITIPVNPASGLVSQAWLDVSCEGSAHIHVFFKRAGSGISDIEYDIKDSNDIWQMPGGIPAGTMMISVFITKSTGVGGITVELKAK
jgi:hypothetical protein